MEVVTMQTSSGVLRVCYSDPKNGWYVQHVDVEDNQVGQAYYTYRKADAMQNALVRQHNNIIEVYGRCGRLQKVVK